MNANRFQCEKTFDAILGVFFVLLNETLDISNFGPSIKRLKATFYILEIY
jgi:hypothetical protein